MGDTWGRQNLSADNGTSDILKFESSKVQKNPIFTLLLYLYYLLFMKIFKFLGHFLIRQWIIWAVIFPCKKRDSSVFAAAATGLKETDNLCRALTAAGNLTPKDILYYISTLRLPSAQWWTWCLTSKNVNIRAYFYTFPLCLLAYKIKHIQTSQIKKSTSNTF